MVGELVHGKFEDIPHLATLLVAPPVSIRSLARLMLIAMVVSRPLATTFSLALSLAAALPLVGPSWLLAVGLRLVARPQVVGVSPRSALGSVQVVFVYVTNRAMLQCVFQGVAGMGSRYRLARRPKGSLSVPKRMNFRKRSKRPLTPPPHFRKIILQIF